MAVVIARGQPALGLPVQARLAQPELALALWQAPELEGSRRAAVQCRRSIRAHIAGSPKVDPLFKDKRLRTIAKGDGLRLIYDRTGVAPRS